jgi:glycosyltransferase involved in cell wall biosynthesis
LPKPYLSIVIPAHNEARRLPATLEQAFAFLDTQPYASEVVVVENGSRDDTLGIARKFQSGRDNMQVLQMDQRGKGRAVRAGMLAAHGDYRFFADADFSMPVSEVNRFIPPALPNVDIAIASREAPGAVRIGEPAYRHMVGRVFNMAVRITALPGLQDSQCGFKCFREDVVEAVFPHQTLTGWSFDVELLFIARRQGYQIVEVPISWYFNPDSKVRVARDSVQMGLDLLSIRWNALRGLYNGRV